MSPQNTIEKFIENSADYQANGTHRVKPPFGYYGAKQRLSARIVAMLPKHNAWVEAFCGSAAITLAKPTAPIEIINDKNGEIVNLFEQLRNNCSELCRAIELTPYAREEFISIRNKTADGMTPLERARAFLVASMMTVNGTIGNQCGFSFSSSYARGGMEARVGRWHNLPERLANVADRLRRVRVENRDACELVEMFVNRPATLVYLDPPYFVKRAYEYVIDANDKEFHEKLLQICCKARCMILLSGYDNPLYREALKSKDGWNRVEIKTHTRDTTGKDYERNEVLWQNKHFVHAFESGRVPIHLSKKERKENKINPER